MICALSSVIRLVVCSVVAATLLSIAASASHGAEPQTLSLAGSSTVRPVCVQAARAIKASDPSVDFLVAGGGSGRGVLLAAEGKVDIGMASRALKQEEKNECPELLAHTIGSDGIAVVVNAKNPVSKIDKKTVQDIFTGKITNWKALGGSDQPILLISKEEGRSTLELFLKYFDLESEELQDQGTTVTKHRVKGEKAFSTAEARIIGPNDMAINATAFKENAISYVSIGSGETAVKEKKNIKLLELDGVPATVDNVAQEQYQLRRPLNLLTKGEPKGLAKTFIDFILSEEGQKLVEAQGFVPVK